jgi:hypothetical protein
MEIQPFIQKIYFGSHEISSPVCYHSAAGTGQAILIHYEDGSFAGQNFETIKKLVSQSNRFPRGFGIELFMG